MSVITEMQLAIETIQTQMSNLCRPATVSYVYRKSGEKGIKTDRDPGDKFIGYVDVQSGELEIWRIPVMASHNGADTTLWLPTEGESGYLFSPSGDLAQAFFVAGIPTETHPLPIPDGQATQSVVRKVREGNSEQLIIKDDADTVVNQYTLEIEKKDESFTKFVHGDSVITLDGDEVKGEHNDSIVTLDDDMVKTEHNDAEIVVDADGVTAKKGTSQAEIVASETKLSRGASSIKMDDSKTAIERATGSIEVKVGLSRLVIGAAGITGYVAGIGRIQMTAVSVNVGGATFVNGVTNLITAVGPVTYPPVPIT
jgi:hypothetical protein